MSTVPKLRFTPDEYLARERQATTKSEYFRGEIFAMSGATREHNLIAGNLIREFGNHLRDRPCEVYPSDMRVKISASGLYTYPDVVVVCGEPRFEDDQLDTLLNPTVLVEVLSESTEGYDRGTKASHYRRIPSLQELVLVAQDHPQIEIHRRQSEGEWLLVEARELSESLTLTSIGVNVPLAEIYRRVEWAAPEGTLPA